MRASFLLWVLAEDVLQQAITDAVAQSIALLELCIPGAVSILQQDALHQLAMGEQRKACIVTAEVHLYDIAVDRLFEHGSLLRHRIGVQADVQDLQVCLLHTAGIGIYGLLLGKQQIHVHHETVAGLSQWQLAGRDPVYLIFDTPHVYQLQMAASAITDRFVEAALYVKQPDGTSAVFDRYVDLSDCKRVTSREGMASSTRSMR